MPRKIRTKTKNSQHRFTGACELVMTKRIYTSLTILIAIIIYTQISLAGGLTIIKDSKAESIVVAPLGQTKLEKQALDDFLGYIKKSTGAQLAVAGAEKKLPANKKLIILSLVDRMPAGMEKPDLTRHAFLYRVTPKQLLIVGADPLGLVNGVCWFLREKLGVRWFMPTELGEEVPKQTTITLATEEKIVEPEFEWIRMTGNQAFMPEEVTWGIRFGDSIYDEDITNNWHFSLNWRYLIPPTKENVEKHPEWFAREEGELPEYNSRHNFCTTNPEVLKIVVQKIREAFDANPKRKMFSLEPNDHQGYCNCKTCKALKKSLGPKAIGTDTFVYFCNQVALELRKTHPDKLLGFYAYGHHMWAPVVVEPDPMLAFMMCRHGGQTCTRHSLLESKCEINQAWRENFDKWCEFLDHRGYYGYWGDYGWFGPEPTTRLATDIPYLKSKKVRYLNSENRFSWATNAPYYYLALRLLTDTSLDPEKVLDEFYRGMYGPAYKPMKRYWTRWIEAWESAPCRNNVGYYMEKAYPPQLVKAACTDLAQAARLVAGANPKYRKRIHYAELGLEYTDGNLAMLRYAADEDYQAAIDQAVKLQKFIKETTTMSEPYPFASHPSSKHHSMVWVNLESKINRYKKKLAEK